MEKVEEGSTQRIMSHFQGKIAILETRRECTAKALKSSQTIEILFVAGVEAFAYFSMEHIPIAE